MKTSALELAPLLLPPAPDVWPLAPGWWLLLASCGLLGTGWLLRQRRPLADLPTPPLTTTDLEPQRQSALDELAALPRPNPGEPAGPWLQALNALLKRLCRTRYPDSASHRLSGRAWLAFLDNRCPAAGLTRWMVLVEGTYRADCRLDEKSINGLQKSVETWIRKHV